MSVIEQQKDALDEITRRGREIVTVDCANRLLAPFGFSAEELNIIYDAPEGVDWGSGIERWRSGLQVNISTLAWVLADVMQAPEVKYDTNYGGSGKRSAAVTAQSVLRLRKMLGEKIKTCEDCGTADLWDSTLCWSCLRDRNDKASYAKILKHTFPAKFTFNNVEVGGRTYYELMKGQERIDDERDWDNPDMLARFYWVDEEEVLEQAYIENAKTGLTGPVEIKVMRR